jgi:hypothetical protein
MTNYTLIIYHPSTSEKDYCDHNNSPSSQDIICTNDESKIVKQYAKYYYQNECGFVEYELTLLINGVLDEDSMEYKKIDKDAKDYLGSFESEEIKLRTLAWL